MRAPPPSIGSPVGCAGGGPNDAMRPFRIDTLVKAPPFGRTLATMRSAAGTGSCGSLFISPSGWRGAKSVTNRIDDRSSRLNDRPRRQVRRFQSAFAHDVENGLAVRHEVVGHDAAVASPPDGFRAHDRAAPRASCIDQMVEPGAEALRKRIVGIVVEARIRPETVHVPRQRS